MRYIMHALLWCAAMGTTPPTILHLQARPSLEESALTQAQPADPALTKASASTCCSRSEAPSVTLSHSQLMALCLIDAPASGLDHHALRQSLAVQNLTRTHSLATFESSPFILWTLQERLAEQPRPQLMYARVYRGSCAMMSWHALLHRQSSPAGL